MIAPSSAAPGPPPTHVGAQSPHSLYGPNMVPPSATTPQIPAHAPCTNSGWSSYQPFQPYACMGNAPPFAVHFPPQPINSTAPFAGAAVTPTAAASSSQGRASVQPIPANIFPPPSAADPFLNTTSPAAMLQPEPPHTPSSSFVLSTPMLPMPASIALSHTNQPRVVQPSLFSGKEREALTTTCDPEHVPAWQVTFLSQLQTKSRDAYYSLIATEADLSSYTIEQRAHVAGWDTALSGVLLSCISKTSERGSLLLSQLAQRERSRPGAVIGSGRAIWAAIDATTRPQFGADLDALERELQKPFFSTSMTSTAVRRAALRLRTLWLQQPLSARGGERELLRELVKKFPTELAEDAKACRKSMHEREACGREYKWSYDQLTSILTSLIVDLNPLEANTMQRGSEEGREQQQQQRQNADGMVCLNCGRKGHKYTECKRKCSYCSLGCCGGVRAQRANCMVRHGVPDDAKDVLGRPLHRAVRERIVKRAQQMKKSAGGDASHADAATMADTVAEATPEVAAESDLVQVHALRVYAHVQ